MARLRQPDTGLRTSADAPLLVQSILDLGAPRFTGVAKHN
jgi:hypothetical protein